MRSHPVSVALAIGFLATLSCGETSQDSSSGGGKAGSGGKPAGGTGGTSGGAGGFGASSGGSAATTSGGSGGTTAPGPVICSGTPCAANQDCCLLDGKCFDPTSADESVCAKPSSSGPNGETACAASSQCALDEYCQPTTGLCLGPGYCLSKTNCGSSGPPSAWCGCDGNDYPDVQTACHAGVVLLGMVACGKTETIGAGGGTAGKVVTFCATDASCPTGQKCCNITGNCYDPAKPGTCAFPPEGTKFPCADDSQCFDASEYCAGEGCDAPGGCKNLPGGSCSGELDPVCGCNGKSYVNASCAAAEGVRVDHAGQCP